MIFVSCFKTRKRFFFRACEGGVINSNLKGFRSCRYGLGDLTADWRKMTIFRYLSKQGEISL